MVIVARSAGSVGIGLPGRRSRFDIVPGLPGRRYAVIRSAWWQGFGHRFWGDTVMAEMWITVINHGCASRGKKTHNCHHHNKGETKYFFLHINIFLF